MKTRRGWIKRFLSRLWPWTKTAI